VTSAVTVVHCPRWDSSDIRTEHERSLLLLSRHEGLSTILRVRRAAWLGSRDMFDQPSTVVHRKRPMSSYSPNIIGTITQARRLVQLFMARTAGIIS
jgi:hypothetical protein